MAGLWLFVSFARLDTKNIDKIVPGLILQITRSILPANSLNTMYKIVYVENFFFNCKLIKDPML